MEQQFKDAKWVAETFDLPLQRVYDLTRRKVIPAVQILRQYRYDPAALSEWAKKGGTRSESTVNEQYAADGQLTS